MQTGIDILLSHPPMWQQQRIGLVTNHAACTATFQPARQALLEHGFNITTLFSPEHGLDTTGADGHLMKDGTDPLTGLPIISLYGDKLAPSANDLASIDIMLFDIPDIGCRFYTYLWTMTHVMEACSRQNIPLVIADRPNPLSGNSDLAEGPLLDEAHCNSFIGRWRLPVKHSCTLGELAKYFNTTRNIHCKLDIIPCNGWKRSMRYTEWSHSFVPLSPAIPTFESALLYPGLCFLEATNISEGRGTATPFRIAGAPWINANETAIHFNTLAKTLHSPVHARPMTFTPTEAKYKGEKCNGVMLHVNEPAQYKAVLAGLLLIRVIKELHPAQFEWATYPTHVNPTGKQHLNLLLGILNAEHLFDLPVKEFIEEAKELLDAEEWKKEIAPFLLYE